MDDDYDYIFKAILIGDSGVGKSNILSKYIKNEFQYDSKATVGVEFASKGFQIQEKKIKTQIWDTAGQERYRSITRAYYKGAKGAFIVYDITNKKSFNNVDSWISSIKTNGEEDVVIILIGNKSDLKDLREVSTEEGREKAMNNSKATNIDLAFYETSALTGDNLENMFNGIVESINIT